MGIAVVGGGIAGCYSAFRLGRAGQGDVDIYEMSDRVGGRLWSVWLEGCDAAPAELGAMFFSSLQSNVHGLINDELKLPSSQVEWKHGRHYLRGKYLTDDDYADPANVPFNLVGGEAARTPEALLTYILGKIAPRFADLWPFNQAFPASPRSTFEYLRTLKHEGRPLHDCGFWNVLNDVASNEAYQLLTSAVGSIALFRNSNAFDTVWNLLHELAPQQFFKLDRGYQSLAQTLWDACDGGAARHLEHRLLRIDRDDTGFVLEFDTPRGGTRKLADIVVLALPRRALQLISYGERVFDDRRTFERLRDESVQPAPASKLFMTFDVSWWESTEFSATCRDPGDVCATHTDLPMQQCYYFGGRPDDTSTAVMASFADDVSTSFWRSSPSANAQAYRNAARGAPVGLECSAAMVASARQQLTALHQGAETALPKGAVFFDWSRDPYGAAWHAWSVHMRSWEARRKIRSPAKDLYVCGEAYAERHGWVEGAINSAEMVMQLLGVARPPWVDSSYEFEREEGDKQMTNQVSELLVALGESSALQRVYRRNADEIMGAFGLDPDQREAMKTGDSAKIGSAANIGDAAFIIVKHTK